LKENYEKVHRVTTVPVIGTKNVQFNILLNLEIHDWIFHMLHKMCYKL